MKNSEIRAGFINKELRDFLSLSLVKTYEVEFNNQKKIIPYDAKNNFDWGIKDAEEELRIQKNRLDYLKDRQAILRIMKMFNWMEFDVSDETEKDLEYRLFMCFIGTDEEYEYFETSLKE